MLFHNTAGHYYIWPVLRFDYCVPLRRFNEKYIRKEISDGLFNEQRCFSVGYCSDLERNMPQLSRAVNVLFRFYGNFSYVGLR